MFASLLEFLHGGWEVTISKEQRRGEWVAKINGSLRLIGTLKGKDRCSVNGL